MQRAVDAVRARYAEAGREVQFRAFEKIDLAPTGETPGYAEVASEQGLTESQVRNYLASVRGDIRSEIRRELAKTAVDENDLEEEWTALFLG